MAERITQQVTVWKDRLLGRDELYNRRASERVVDAFLGWPMPIKALLVGVISRFDSDVKEGWTEALIDIASNTGGDSSWARASLWFVDGPTRRITNHRIDHALIEHTQRGGQIR